jgi:hypothetical protein
MVEVGATDAEVISGLVVDVKADGIVVVVVVVAAVAVVVVLVVLAAVVAVVVVVVVAAVVVVVVVVVVGQMRDTQPHWVRASHTMQFVSKVPPCKVQVLAERDEGRPGGAPVSRFLWT